MQPLVFSFDVGGTLIRPWPSVGAVYGDAAREISGIPWEAEALDRSFAAAWSQARKSADGFDYSRLSWANLVRQTFGDRLAPEHFEPVFETVWNRFTDPPAWQMYPDVIPTLEAMRSLQCRMEVLSNWDVRLRPLLVRLGLAHYFEDIVVSGELGIHKPDPRIFALASHRWGVLPGQVFHVGDSESEDLRGALAAGWQARQIVRSAEDTTDCLRSLAGLLKVIGGEVD